MNFIDTKKSIYKKARGLSSEDPLVCLSNDFRNSNFLREPSPQMDNDYNDIECSSKIFRRHILAHYLSKAVSRPYQYRMRDREEKDTKVSGNIVKGEENEVLSRERLDSFNNKNTKVKVNGTKLLMYDGSKINPRSFESERFRRKTFRK